MNNSKFAFTLAEVLITLGIIGVVAAMTIPTLVSNYQKRAWTAQLQKSYAVLNQGFRRMLADDGVSALSQTETFQSIGGSGCGYDEAADGESCHNFLTNLRKYFNISDIKRYNSNEYKTNSLAGEVIEFYNATAIILADGTMINTYSFRPYDHSDEGDHFYDVQLKRVVGNFYIDVNGVSRPNKLGRDIFWFYLGDDGIVYPVGSMAVASYNLNCEYIDKMEEGYWKTSNNADYNCKDDGDSPGNGCAARVLETGKMDY